MAIITNEFVAVGDSITQGLGATTPWPGIVGTELGVTSHNEGYSGEGWIFTNPSSGHFLSDSTRTNTVDAYVANNPDCYLTLEGGANDFLNGSTLEETYEAFEDYLEARVTAGWQRSRIIVCTLTSANDDLYDAAVIAYNAMLVAGRLTHQYALARVDLDPLVGGRANSTNTTYFQIDEPGHFAYHPNNTGLGVIADVVMAAQRRWYRTSFAA